MSIYERGLRQLRREVVTRREFPPSGVLFRTIPPDGTNPREQSATGSQARRSLEKITFLPDHDKLKAGDQSEWSRWHEAVDVNLKDIFSDKLGTDRDEAERIVQEAWVAVFKNIHKITPDNLTGYLYRIAERRLIDFLRSKSIRQEEAVEPDILARLVPAVDHKGEQSIVSEEARQEAVALVGGLLERLAPQYREQIDFLLEGLTLQEIAESLGISEGAVKQRRRTAMQAVKTLLEEGKSPQEAAKEKRESQWLQTIDNISYPMSIRCLLIEEGIQQKKFLKAAKIGKATIRNNKTKSFSLDTANRVLVAADLDTDSKASQLLRLKCMGDDAINKATLDSSSPGKLFKYVRTVMGLSQKDVEKKTHIHKGTITNLETDKSHAAMKSYIEIFMRGLKLSREDPFIDFLLQKIEGRTTPLSQEEFAVLAEGKYLIRDKNRSRNKILAPEKDKHLLVAINANANTFGKGLEIMRLSNKLTQKMLAEKMDPPLPVEQISQWENSIYIPYDATIAQLAIAVANYTVHHPILWKLLELVDQDRDRQKKERLQRRKQNPQE